MTEHTIIIGSMGGTTVLSCETLQIKNIEFPFGEVNEETIKKTILDYKYLNEKDAKFDLVIIDNRPPSENYNEKKARESKEFKKSRNDMTAAKM